MVALGSVDGDADYFPTKWTLDILFLEQIHKVRLRSVKRLAKAYFPINRQTPEAIARIGTTIWSCPSDMPPNPTTPATIK